MATDAAAELESLIGGENARRIVIAFLCLSVYEWILTLEDEIDYFWTGPWELSRILFLLNRYLNPAINVLALICFSVLNPSIPLYVRSLGSSIFILLDPSNNSCQRGIQTLFVAAVLALGVVQAMLVIRVWYLFGHSRSMRATMVACYVATNALSLYFAVVAGLETLVQAPRPGIPGCHATRPPKFWRLYIPSLVLHTIVYFMTAYRALKNRRLFKEAPIFKRLVRDGGFFYFVVFISITLTAIGSFLTQHPKLNIPAIFSNFPVATTSIAASRVMLSIHSLAAKLGSESAWALNKIELSRVAWRRGATEGEIIVDRLAEADAEVDGDEWSCEGPYRSVAEGEEYSPSRSMVSLKTSRVGRWTDETW